MNATNVQLKRWIEIEEKIEKIFQGKLRELYAEQEDLRELFKKVGSAETRDHILFVETTEVSRLAPKKTLLPF